MKVAVLVTFLAAGLAMFLSGCGNGTGEELPEGWGTVAPEEAQFVEAFLRHQAGVKLQEQGNLEEAVAEYGEAIRYNPRLTQTYVSRAITYILLGRDAEAQQDVDRAVELGEERAPLEQQIQSLKNLR